VVPRSRMADAAMLMFSAPVAGMTHGWVDFELELSRLELSRFSGCRRLVSAWLT